jgi:hypothetical protein
VLHFQDREVETANDAEAEGCSEVSQEQAEGAIYRVEVDPDVLLRLVPGQRGAHP